MEEVAIWPALQHRAAATHVAAFIHQREGVPQSSQAELKGVHAQGNFHPTLDLQLEGVISNSTDRGNHAPCP